MTYSIEAEAPSDGRFGLASASSRMVRTMVRSRLNPPGRRPAGSPVPLTDYDPTAPSVLEDPYPHYRRLLDGGPLHYMPRRNAWVISGFDAVRAALRTDQVLSSAEGVNEYRISVPMLLTSDRPEHTRLRALVAGEFSRGGLERWQATIDEQCDEMIAAMVRRGRCDAVADLADPLPIQVIMRMLDVPLGDRARFRDWSNRMVAIFNIRLSLGSLPTLLRSMGGSTKMFRYLGNLLAQRQSRPGDDVLSRLRDHAGAGGLSDDELVWFAVLLLVAGNETTTNLLGPLVRNLAVHPDQYALLRAEPELIPKAIDEQLRYQSPIQGLYRTALEDYEVADGLVIPAGGRVLVLYASANRDPEHYPEPDEFRVDRQPTDHLAFGSGIHYCLGAFLSKLEARRALGELVRQVERIEPDGPGRPGRTALMHRAAHVPVRLVPSA
ncbi:MAG TPA: cytochrome P450 [Pseudonocardia sp.]|nr:cytochrome P450 [Pseudonocardia sp.]